MARLTKEAEETLRKRIQNSKREVPVRTVALLLAEIEALRWEVDYFKECYRAQDVDPCKKS